MCRLPATASGNMSKEVIIVEVYHDILYPAVENITKSVDRVHFYIFIMSKPVNLGAIDIVIRIQIVLSNVFFFHGFP